MCIRDRVSNYSMDFDGTNDKIEFGDVNNFERTDAFSGSCWVFYEGVTGASQYIISKHNSSNNKGYQFYLNSAGSLNFIIGPGPGSAVMQVSVGVQQTNTWNHFVFTYDGSSLRTGINVYVNGVIQTRFFAGLPSITGTIKDASIPFQISGRSGTSANGVNGKIDQVSIFDYELSQDQVTQLHNPGYAFNFIPNDYIDLGTTTAYDTGDLSAATWVNASSSRTGTGYPFSNSGSPAIAGFDFVIYTNNQVRIRRSTMTKTNQTNQIDIGLSLIHISEPTRPY